MRTTYLIGNFSTRCWIQYHNFERYGFPAEEILDDEPMLPLSEAAHYISTNKQWITKTKGDTIFLIFGISAGRKKDYYLWTKTIVKEIEEINIDGEFEYNASGEQFYLNPPQKLNDKTGFEEFFEKSGHFSIGFQNITDWKFTETLKNLCEEFKYKEEDKLSFKQYIDKFIKSIKKKNK